MTNPDALARKCVDALWVQDHASQGLGMALESVREGAARLSLEVAPHMVNGHGICHGGIIFSLADSAFAFACNSRNRVSLGSSCTIEFLRPAKLGDHLIATAGVVHQGKRSGICDVTVVEQSQRVVAHFRGRFRQLDAAILTEDAA